MLTYLKGSQNISDKINTIQKIKNMNKLMKEHILYYEEHK